MRDRLIDARTNLEMQIQTIDKALKFFDEHPEMETMMSAYMAVMGSMMGGFRI